MLLLFALALVSIGQSFSFGNLLQFTRNKPILGQNTLNDSYSLRLGNVTSINRFDNSANDELATCDLNEFTFPCLCTGVNQDPQDCYCTGATNEPKKCTPQDCVSSDQQYPCFCVGNIDKDTDGCLCSGLPDQPSNCTYPSCISSEQQYPCFCTSDIGKDIDGCLCSGSPNQPSYCIYPICTSSDQTNPCLCNGTDLYPTDCVCNEIEQLVDHCKIPDCTYQYDSKPCLCTGKADRDTWNCICSGKEKAGQQCEQMPCQYNNELYPGKCLCDIDNHPEDCTPVACEDTEQEYQCLCQGQGNDKDGCICTDISQLDYHCKLLDCITPYDPNLCLCTGKDSKDISGCICSGKEKAEQYCTLIPCQDETKLFPDVCLCDTINHPEGCIPVSCEDQSQDYPCLCTEDPSVNKEDCLCATFGQSYSGLLPDGCTVEQCEHFQQTYPCLCTGDPLNDPYDCLCSGQELDGQFCIPLECKRPEQDFLCICTGDDLKDTPFCVCSSEHHPELCTCMDYNDQDCICSEHWDTPNCTRVCKEGEFPETFNCVCPEDDTCKAGPQSCIEGTYTQPLPLGCKPKLCSEDPHLCKCTGTGSDEVNCFCSEQYNNINYCSPRQCESSDQYYPCLCTGYASIDPSECICNNVDDPSQFEQCTRIDCKDPNIMYPGRCGCTQANHPLGCEPTLECHRSNQEYPCFCNGDDVDTPDCFCGGPSDPIGCLCSSPYDSACLCNDIIKNDNCVPTCQDGQFPDYDQPFDKNNCFCDYKDQTCLDGPNACTDENYDPEYPYACKIVNCRVKTQDAPCICTGNEDLDTSKCICKEDNNGKVEPGSCYCDTNLEPGHYPTGCLCKEKGDSLCVCNDIEGDTYFCYTICDIDQGQYPKVSQSTPYPGCLCRLDDEECLERTLQCNSGTYIHPQPSNCYPSYCTGKLLDYPCLCTGDTNLDPQGCRDHLCNQGEFPGSDNCMCSHNDGICQAGREPCSGGSYDEPSPTGCYPVQCTDSNQILPCICTGQLIIDRPDCVCIGATNKDTGLCIPQYCGAGGGGDCICGGPDQSNPPGCICNGNATQPDDCRPAIPTTEYDGSCTGGTNINPYPLNCEIKVCKSSEQTAPCICSGKSSNNRPDCMCSAATGASVEQGSCICGLGHHPTGCICSSSSDSGCICSSTLATNPSDCTSIDCKVDSSAIVEQDSCVCTNNNHPTGCKPILCKGTNDYSLCLCSGIDNEPVTCALDVCKSSSQQIPCICTEDSEKNPSGCICSQGNADTVTPQGSCTCRINHHPTGCTCSSSSDSGCICSSISANNPSGCICSTIQQNPPSCTIQDCKVNSDTTVTSDSCYCTNNNHPTGCKLIPCTGTNDYEQCLCSGIASEPETCTPVACKSSSQQYPCICTGTNIDTPTCLCSSTPGNNPPGCICSQRNEDTVTLGSCTCGINHHPTGCNCSSSSDSGCVCTINLDQNPSLCTFMDCTEGSDPRLEETCTCTKEYHQESCSCPRDSADLVDIPEEACICRKTGDPRADGICPSYCESKDIPNYHCVCDNESTSYSPSQCKIDKQCTEDSDKEVEEDSCVCTGTHHPTNCKCPDDSSDLECIPEDRCQCRSTADPRASGLCPAYCKGPDDPSAECVCDTSGLSSTYNLGQCRATKICISDNDPVGCKPACDIGEFPETTNCLCRTDDDKCKLGICKEGTFDQPKPLGCTPVACKTTDQEYACLCEETNHPSGCTPVACISSSQQYPCICTGTDVDTPNCTCSQGNADTVTPQGSCTCSINHHPTGCTCSSSSDSGCICSSTLATNPSTCTIIDCKVDSGTTVTKDSCVCTSTNHPDGCECPTDSTKLAGIPAGQCGCLPSGDLRQECKVNILACASDTVPSEGCICTGTYHPDSCTCPTAVDELNGIPKDQCSCLSGDNDKRDDCKAKKGGGLSAGAIAGIIVAIIVVVLGVIGIIIGYFAYKKYWSSPERSSSARSLGSQNRWGSSRSVRRLQKVHDSFEMSQTQSAGSLSTPGSEPSIRVGTG